MKIEQLHKIFLTTKGIGTDTRAELNGKLFFALKGENFNGNEYASQAISNGAAYSVIDEVKGKLEDSFILVDDVLQTLQNLAKYHRSLLGTPILAITGTNGKTTNKELISRVLAQKFVLLSTKGNFNNHIGVPLSILEITEKIEFAVIEMGANKVGDIKELCEIADPDYGFITNIGVAHLEGFGSAENIKIGKGELFNHISSKNGLFFVNASEQAVAEISRGYQNNYLVGSEFGPRFTLRQSNPNIVFDFEQEGLMNVVESNLYGKHNYENLKMAVAIGLYFGVDSSNIAAAIRGYNPDNNRSQVIVRKGLNIFMDAYNANPTSMEASIRSFAAFEDQTKVLILGDMFELGQNSIHLHQKLIDMLSGFKWHSVVFIGENFLAAKVTDRTNMYFYKDKASADRDHNWNFSKGTNILIKGSRGLALEKLKFIQDLI